MIYTLFSSRSAVLKLSAEYHKNLIILYKNSN